MLGVCITVSQTYILFSSAGYCLLSVAYRSFSLYLLDPPAI